MTERTSPRRAPAAATRRPGFSAATRANAWRELGSDPFDLVVIGGGITGVGVAWDAAGRGLRVLLLEAGDFGEGTSSRSSRLIHGGLRYLENLHFRLVFEALAERRRLLELAPHLVRALSFTYPVYASGGVGMLKLMAGMWAYDALALFQNIQGHRMLSRRATLAREPGLAGEGLQGAAIYYDAQVDDARLTLAVARAAHGAGATLLPRARVVGFTRGPDGRVTGVQAEDAVTGEAKEIRASLVVGAVGPWTDEMRRLLDPAAPPRLRPTKGAHIQLPAARVGNRGALIFQSPLDGRVMFVLPWGDYTYVGTTDTDYDGHPAEAVADAADVDYLLASLNAVFPEAHATRADILSSWAGVRPLVSPDPAGGRLSTSQTSREHEIWREPAGPLVVAGGKLTTFRVMAAEVVDEAVDILGRERDVRTRPYDTGIHRLPGAPAGDWDEFAHGAVRRGTSAGLSPTAAERIVSIHGTDADAVFGLIGEDPRLATPLLPTYPYLRAEAVHGVRGEMALTLEDILRRRLHLFNDDADGGMAAAEETARLVAAEPGLAWDESGIAAQVARYADAVVRTRQRPG